MKYLFPFAAVLLLSACYTSNALSKEEKEAKQHPWVNLFDGKSLSGWHRYGGGAIDPVWKIRDGALCVDTLAMKKNEGEWDIVTDNEYTDFDLKLEWMISPGGNSGIMFNVVEDKSKFGYPWQTGPEMQILDNDRHSDGKILKHHAGDLFDLISCSKETVRPVGQWNDVEIKIFNAKLNLYLNGENVISTTMWDDNWKRLIAGSKFKSMEGFGTYRKGRICLQDHGNAVCFRNVRIKQL